MIKSDADMTENNIMQISDTTIQIYECMAEYKDEKFDEGDL